MGIFEGNVRFVQNPGNKISTPGFGDTFGIFGALPWGIEFLLEKIENFLAIWRERFVDGRKTKLGRLIGAEIDGGEGRKALEYDGNDGNDDQNNYADDNCPDEF